jgi:hypothetical protein
MDGSLAEYLIMDNLLDAVPQTSSEVSSAILPAWIQVGANITLFLSNVSCFYHNMNPMDKHICDAAYDEEYDGLSSLPT